MELILLRHGQTPGNLLKQYIGSTDEPLAPEGIEAASRRRESILPVERLWVSPLLRCKQTAALIWDLPQIVIPDLRECDFGAFERKTYEELKSDARYRAWIDGGMDAVCPGGESNRAFNERCVRAISKLIDSLRNEPISRGGIVAHGGTIMAVLYALGVPKREFYDWQVKNCCGYRLSVSFDPPQLHVIEEIK